MTGGKKVAWHKTKEQKVSTDMVKMGSRSRPRSTTVRKSVDEVVHGAGARKAWMKCL